MLMKFIFLLLLPITTGFRGLMFRLLFLLLPLKNIYSIEHIVIFEILFMVDLVRGIWKK